MPEWLVDLVCYPQEKENIDKCLICDLHHLVEWIGAGMSPTMANIHRTIRNQGVLGPLAKEIWVSIGPKVAILLWWMKISTKDQLSIRGILTKGKCLLCDTANEDIKHIIFNCMYSKQVLKEYLAKITSHINLPKWQQCSPLCNRWIAS